MRGFEVAGSRESKEEMNGCSGEKEREKMSWMGADDWLSHLFEKDVKSVRCTINKSVNLKILNMYVVT